MVQIATADARKYDAPAFVLNCTLYVVADVVAGLSRKVRKCPPSRLFASPPKGFVSFICVLPRTRLKVTLLVDELYQLSWANTKTLLEVDFGVILADNPASEYVPEPVLVCVVVVPVTICRTVPFVGVVAAKYRHAEPFQIATISVSVSYIICPSYGAVGRVVEVQTPGRNPVELFEIAITNSCIHRHGTHL